MSDLTIQSVEAHLTQPGRHRLLVVRVRTSEPGLYGVGCATFTQRPVPVRAAIEEHLAPQLIGRDPRDIEDLWHVMTLGGYWRGGPVLNSAVGGVDMALWDVAGKLAGAPCCRLWGGKCRPAAAVYLHADGSEVGEVVERARQLVSEGVRTVRCQLGGYRGSQRDAVRPPEGAKGGQYFDPSEKLRRVPALFERLRAELGPEVGLLYDVHERLAPPDAVQLAKALEPYRLLFLEDPVAPEDADWLARIRSICATPLAMGELFADASQFTPLVARRRIDYVRAHLSMIGGITPALKLARLCEAFGVRTAWHGPPDLSPIGQAANLHLDLACHNFGIQEWSPRAEAEDEVFPGAPELRDGCGWVSDRPGLGVDFDEAAAAKYPPSSDDPAWTEARGPDGSIRRP